MASPQLAPRIYLDHNATSPMVDVVIREMTRVMREVPGNPSSLHQEGVQARYEVEKARRNIARLINAPSPDCIVFTAGGTESINLALRGAAQRQLEVGHGIRLLTSSAEHRAVLDTMEELAITRRYEVAEMPVDEWAVPILHALRHMLWPDVALVSLMLANNETGSISPIIEYVRLVRELVPTALFHCDAMQAVGRIPVDVQSLGVDLLSFGAHKVGGPKGVGALYIRPGLDIQPQCTGGGQERGLRSGTENVAAIVGFAAALKAACEGMTSAGEQQRQLREELWQEISVLDGAIIRNSAEYDCLPNTLHISLHSMSGQELVRELDARGFAVSTGSACTSNGTTQLSHVALACGLSEVAAHGALRISLGPSTTREETQAFVQTLAQLIRKSEQCAKH